MKTIITVKLQPKTQDEVEQGLTPTQVFRYRAKLEKLREKGAFGKDVELRFLVDFAYNDSTEDQVQNVQTGLDAGGEGPSQTM